MLKPLDYPHLIWLMNQSFLVLTDSGGIQEEAPSLGKPVLVIRTVTERTEGLEAGTTKLVGTDGEVIFKEVETLLNSEEAYAKISTVVNPYGNGDSCEQIVSITKRIKLEEQN
jgi:UDP-N-acetylglucosamine 2-epimerase (non-hydrolysing)